MTAGDATRVAGLEHGAPRRTTAHHGGPSILCPARRGGGVAGWAAVVEAPLPASVSGAISRRVALA